jgi:hypothetical protein
MRIPQTANLSLNITKTHVFSLSSGTLHRTTAQPQTRYLTWVQGILVSMPVLQGCDNRAILPMAMKNGHRYRYRKAEGKPPSNRKKCQKIGTVMIPIDDRNKLRFTAHT